MNKSARKAVNLSVLQRHDAHICDILDSSSYVVVYKFDEASRAWTKKGVEGTMFVFKRSTAPTYGFFIMNRLGIDNLMADLTADFSLQLTSDYIIYQDEKDIHGIWVYEPSDRDRIGEKLLDCCKRAKEDDAQPSFVPPSVTKSTSISSTSSASRKHGQSQRPAAVSSPAANENSGEDPLSRMLSNAMSRARVSENSGAPMASYPNAKPSPAVASASERSAHQGENSTLSPSSSSTLLMTLLSSGQQRDKSPVFSDPSIISQSRASPPPAADPSSLLLAMLTKDQDRSTPPRKESPLSQHTHSPASGGQVNGRQHGFESNQAMLLNSLAGPGKQLNGPSGSSSARGVESLNASQGPPLSAEFLPASVMPSGLYSSSTPRANDGSAGPGSTAQPIQQHQQQHPQQQFQPQQLQHPHQQHQALQQHGHPSAMATASLLNRPNSMSAHGSPLQAPAFAYSPHMMPSPLSMPMMAHGSMATPPPPPPPMPFHHPHHPHHPHPGMKGLPPPPPPPLMGGGGGGASFPADAMYAAMGAVGMTIQQQQQQQGSPHHRGFVGPDGEVMPKHEFTQQFMALVQNDVQFMEVLYSNYFAIFARRG